MAIAPKPLERYLEVTKWDSGYMVVQAKYSTSPRAVGERIDLVLTPGELHIGPELFCSLIERVEVSHVDQFSVNFPALASFFQIGPCNCPRPCV